MIAFFHSCCLFYAQFGKSFIAHFCVLFVLTQKEPTKVKSNANSLTAQTVRLTLSPHRYLSPFHSKPNSAYIVTFTAPERTRYSLVAQSWLVVLRFFFASAARSGWAIKSSDQLFNAIAFKAASKRWVWVPEIIW